MNSILLPEQTLVAPDRGIIKVDAFRIAVQPVNVDAFRRFANQASYVTQAERLNDEFNVYSNPRFEDSPIPNSRDVPAACVSLSDARTYCSHQKLSLPSVDQWMAFVKYVCDKDLFVIRRRSESKKNEESLIRFYTAEWLESPLSLVGVPPMKKISGIPHQCEPYKMIEKRPSPDGNLFVTFRAVLPNK